jgi:hypothetical protein
MKKITVMGSHPGHSLKELVPETWSKLELVNGANLEETADEFIIHLTNGTKLKVAKKIIDEDEHRVYYAGSLSPISDIPFRFILMKNGGLCELWDYYFLPGQGGFSMLCSLT